MMNLEGFSGKRPWPDRGIIYLEKLKMLTKSSVRIAGVPVEIRTKHHPNISLEHYRCENLLRASVVQKGIVIGSNDVQRQNMAVRDARVLLDRLR
jgi:hypothetical protein